MHALNDVDFDVRAGEIHALLGQNGAGKSTLMNILSGVIAHDSGELIINGAKVKIREPKHAQALGISIVHQELSLFPSRSVAENIFVGRLPRKHGFVQQRELIEMAPRGSRRTGDRNRSSQACPRSAVLPTTID